MSLIESLAAANDVYIGYGYAEAGGASIYNSFALIDPDGILIANERTPQQSCEVCDLLPNHRKVYLAPTLDDVDGFTAGASPTTAYIDEIKVGLEICMDMSSKLLAETYGKDPDIKIILSPLADAGRL
jgi:predicted amidohydrolase